MKGAGDLNELQHTRRLNKENTKKGNQTMDGWLYIPEGNLGGADGQLS